jgi:hypothetical protein
LRTYDTNPGIFVCPSTDAKADKYAGGPSNPQSRSNFSSKSNLSYSVAYPYPDSAAVTNGYKWGKSLKTEFAIAADMNPGTSPTSDNVLAPTPTSPRSVMKKANSNNHSKAGQNVLFADGRVVWCNHPFVGIDRDNIYTRQGSTPIASDTTSPFGAPTGRFDSVLGVTDEDTSSTGGSSGGGGGDDDDGHGGHGGHGD